MITFIKGIDNKHVTVNSKTAYEGGQAFGMFLRGVSALNPKELNVIIPDFHSLEYRFKQFQQALENNLAKEPLQCSLRLNSLNHGIQRW